MSKNSNEAVRRISEIRWDMIGNKSEKSHAELLKEYLRRSAVFLHLFSKTVKTNYVYNAANIAGKNFIFFIDR